MNKQEGEMYVVVTRYVTDRGTVVVHAYCPRTSRKRAMDAKKRILAATDHARVEAHIVKVLEA